MGLSPPRSHSVLVHNLNTRIHTLTKEQRNKGTNGYSRQRPCSGGGENAQHEEAHHKANQKHFNEMDLAYARAAAVVRALPYRLSSDKSHRSIESSLRKIPFLGPSVCHEIRQMLKTGTRQGFVRSAFSIQHSAFSMQHAAFSIQHSAFTVLTRHVTSQPQLVCSNISAYSLTRFNPYHVLTPLKPRNSKRRTSA